MRILILIAGVLSAATGSTLSDEIFENILSKEIEQDLNKRMEHCDYVVNSSTIIRTNESLTAGAVFIDSKRVFSQKQCQNLCCGIENCNVAVYESEHKHSCYIFDCGTPNKCMFTYHSRYSVIAMKDLAKTPEIKHENDLQSLGNLADNEDEETSTVTTTTRRSTTTKTTTVATSTTQKIVPLLHPCHSGDLCEGSRTHCVSGFCRCEDGFHPKNGVCRQNCKHQVEFECTNGDAKYTGPDCIAVYDMCDSIAQCADGSDELNCKTKGATTPVTKQQVPPPVNYGTSSKQQNAGTPGDSIFGDLTSNGDYGYENTDNDYSDSSHSDGSTRQGTGSGHRQGTGNRPVDITNYSHQNGQSKPNQQSIQQNTDAGNNQGDRTGAEFTSHHDSSNGGHKDLVHSTTKDQNLVPSLKSQNEQPVENVVGEKVDKNTDDLAHPSKAGSLPSGEKVDENTDDLAHPSKAGSLPSADSNHSSYSSTMRPTSSTAKNINAPEPVVNESDMGLFSTATTKESVNTSKSNENNDITGEISSVIKPKKDDKEDNIVKEANNNSASKSSSESQVAVVALSLGLGIMALLLLFVGCRYRNMRRKIRRGRPLDSNEADYLINGMYL